MTYPNTGRVNQAALDSALRLAEDERVRKILATDEVAKQLAPYGVTRMATDDASSLRRRFLEERGLDVTGVNAKGLEALTNLALDQMRYGSRPEEARGQTALSEFEKNLGIAPLKKLTY